MTGWTRAREIAGIAGRGAVSRKRDVATEPTRYDEIAGAKPRRVMQGNVVPLLPDDARMGGGLDGISEADALTSTAGVQATHEALQELLKNGNPLFREKKVWAPHRPERPAKSEGGLSFVMKAPFEPRGDQPEAIRQLVEGVQQHERDQVLLGVTGSGKTFTMAQVIEKTQRPALILAPNKTLAAQLYSEFKSFFRRTRSSISSPITTTTSPRPMCRGPTPTSPRNRPSTRRSTACATRRRVRCSNAMT